MCVCVLFVVNGRRRPPAPCCPHLQRCLEAGARLARQGEFTLRAFLNGRLDLSQAESVAQVGYQRDNGRP